MTLSSGKHIELEINGVRCRVVEAGASRERVDFLKELLENNGYEVEWAEEVQKPPVEGEPQAPVTYVIGVTDIIFNAVVAVYQRLLKTPDGKKVTPDYWNQKTSDLEPNYWDRGKKDWTD